MVVPEQGPRRVLCRYVGRRVRTIDGRVLGDIDDVLVDARSGAVQWLVLRVRGMRRRHRAIPVNLSIEVRGQLVVPTTRHTLLAAPHVRLGGALTASQERRLRAHWTTY